MRPTLPRVALVLALAGLPASASAHVKWFSDFNFGDRPLTIQEVATPTFVALALITAIIMGALVVLDARLSGAPWYKRIVAALEKHRDRSGLILRIATGAVMLLNWQADAMLVPELPASEAWVGWFQFAIALLLLGRRTVPMAGLGLLAVYALGIVQFGPFHMLDYFFYAGFGVYFLVSGAPVGPLRSLGLPALYATVGFSLFWVGLEKLVYPQWGLYVLSQNPALALGFPLDFFLVGAAFVELGLGYLLIIGLLERPFALLITLVFFATTLVFGKLEVIGHTMLHAALLVFLIEGSVGRYRPPVRFHRRPRLRVAFAAVNFVVLLVLLLLPYAAGARRMYEAARAGELPPVRPAPGLEEAPAGVRPAREERAPAGPASR
jgi:uncharacterized membrane protein YphA (DoxX/SURF4 family)